VEPEADRLHAALSARGAVRRGRHWRIRCPFPEHVDEHPSCDVDLDRGFVCRACGRGGSLRTLAELLGLQPARTIKRPVSPLARLASDLARQPGARDTYRHYSRVADWIRHSRAEIMQLRRLASELGDSDAVWDLLARVNEWESLVSMWDAVLEDGGLADDVR
jgi:hypothetical protein